jgi:hypothetical protein
VRRGKSSHPTGNSNAATHTHRCAPRKVAYIVSGAITDGTGMTQDSAGGTWSGSLVYTVTHHNRWARGDSGTATLRNVNVLFTGGTSDFSAGNRVKLIGKVEYVRVKGQLLHQPLGAGSADVPPGDRLPACFLTVPTGPACPTW